MPINNKLMSRAEQIEINGLYMIPTQTSPDFVTPGDKILLNSLKSRNDEHYDFAFLGFPYPSNLERLSAILYPIVQVNSSVNSSIEELKFLYNKFEMVVSLFATDPISKKYVLLFAGAQRSPTFSIKLVLDDLYSYIKWDDLDYDSFYIVTKD